MKKKMEIKRRPGRPALFEKACKVRVTFYVNDDELAKMREKLLIEKRGISISSALREVLVAEKLI